MNTAGPPTPPQSRSTYPLTSLRFFAALLVLYHHSTWTFLPLFYARAENHGVPHGFIPTLSSTFTVSVSFFFLVSGYVLSLVYLRNPQPLNLRKFFIARFARLYPLYLVVQTADSFDFLSRQIQLHTLPIAIVRTGEVWLANLCLLQVWTRGLLEINPPSWTLCCEALFYLCFPVIGRRLWTLRGARLWIAAILLYAGGQALVFAVRPHVDILTAHMFPLLHLSTFALGILLARHHTLQQERQDRPPISQSCACAVLVLSLTGLIVSVPLQSLFHGRNPYNDGLLAPIFAGIIWSLSATPTALSRLLCVRWLIALGNASYALYLIHDPIRALFQHFNWIGPVFYAVYIVLCIGLSLLSFHYFETPIRLWLVARLERQPNRQPVLTPPLHPTAAQTAPPQTAEPPTESA